MLSDQHQSRPAARSGLHVVGCDHVASDDLLDSVAELVAHGGLVGAAQVEHEIGPTVGTRLRSPG
jgi:hypothetical protein